MATKGRIIGVDLGTVRIGIASADFETRIASPMETYVRRTEALDAAYFRQLAKNERAALFVVGLPLHAGGSESTGSADARRFALRLQEWTGVPVTLCDERYTTAFAEELLIDAGIKRSQRKGKRDRIAAQMILAAFLESCDAQRDGEALRLLSKSLNASNRIAAEEPHGPFSREAKQE